MKKSFFDIILFVFIVKKSWKADLYRKMLLLRDAFFCKKILKK